MHPDVRNTARPLAYSGARYLRRALMVPLWMLAICVVVIRFASGKAAFAGYIGIVASLVAMAYYAYEIWGRPRPLLQLTSQGMVYR
ncbi:MAG TPA: hypothetical protein PK264_12765, partial [Hyphomicrobiaceae bacterium]|nr:hypothetical protein [Hyphomicrobiaceae bacterium]